MKRKHLPTYRARKSSTRKRRSARSERGPIDLRVVGRTETPTYLSGTQKFDPPPTQARSERGPIDLRVVGRMETPTYLSGTQKFDPPTTQARSERGPIDLRVVGRMETPTYLSGTQKFDPPTTPVALPACLSIHRFAIFPVTL